MQILYKRKYFGLVLLVMVIVSIVFTGCSKTSSRKVTVIFAHEGASDVTSLYREAVRKFEEKNPDIAVKEIQIEGPYYPKIMTMIAGGTPPDVMWLGRGFGEFSHRKALLNIDSMVKNDKTFDLKKYDSRVMEWYKYNGELYGLPLGTDVAIFAYNKKLFDKEKTPYPTESWTYQDMLSAARRLTKDLNGDGRTEQFGIVIERDVAPSIGAYGGAIIKDENGLKCTLNEPAAVEALSSYVDLMNKEKVHPVYLGGTYGVLEQFITGKVAMYYTYSWVVNTMSKQIKTFDWDITLLPKNKKRVHWASSQGFAIYSKTKCPKEAYLLLKHLVDTEFEKAMSKATVPSLLKVAKEASDEHKGAPAHYSELLKALDYAQPDPRIPFITEIMNIKIQEEDQAIQGIKTPQKAYDDAAERINKLLNSKDNKKTLGN